LVASNFILVFFSVAVAALVIAVIWEWRHPDPVVEIRLLSERNFAIANFLLFSIRLHAFRITADHRLTPNLGSSLTITGARTIYDIAPTEPGVVAALEHSWNQHG